MPDASRNPPPPPTCPAARTSPAAPSATTRSCAASAPAGWGRSTCARQLSLKREVALKLLRNDLAANATALLRFQAEAEAVAKLNHPNIVHIHQIGEHDGLRYMVLEYVDGRNLRDYLARKGPPDLPVTLSVIRQVVLALQKAHEQGIVHRDIKPENILVTAQGRGEGHRLRAVAVLRRATPATQPDAERRDARHAAVHVAGAGAGEGGRSPQRHLLARRDLLPPARRRAAVPRRRRPSTWR